MNAVVSTELNLIRLTDALLCANCELIVNETFGGKCPACGSGALLSVCRALGGPLEYKNNDWLPAKLQVVNSPIKGPTPDGKPRRNHSVGALECIRSSTAPTVSSIL
jgi:hypothetical protein